MNKPLHASNSKVNSLAIVSNGLLLLCGMVGLIRTFLSLYPELLSHLTVTPEIIISSIFIPRDQLAPAEALATLPLQLTLWAVIGAVVSLIAWSLPRRARTVAVILLSVLLVAAGFRYRLYLIEGAKEIAAAVYNPFANHFGLDRISPAFSFEAADRFTGATLFLKGALAVISLLLGWAVVRVQRWWIAAILTLLPVLPAMFTNVYPHWGWFTLLGAFLLAMLLGSLCRKSGGRSTLTLTALPAAALLIGLVVTLLPQKSYTYPDWAYRTWEKMASITGELSDRGMGNLITIPGPAPSGIRPKSENLAGAGPLNYSGKTALEVSGDYSGRVYLRNRSLAVYTGESWEPLEEAAYSYEGSISPLLFPSQLGSAGEHRTLLIFNQGLPTTDTFLPYPLAEQNFRENGLTLVEDSAVVSDEARRRVEVEFLPYLLDLEQYSPATDPEFLTDRATYTEFVMEHYTKTDSDLLSLMVYPLNKIPAHDGAIIFYHSGLVTAPEIVNTKLGSIDRSYLSRAERVTRWLAEQCVYDPDTPVTPEGEDFAEHFLTTGRGYCMHFATAATLLLREMGVPARYVTGYVADPRRGQVVEVPDYAAHAWVEIYLPGYGWYPVEVTPGYDFEGAEVADETEETDTPSPSPSPSVRPSKELPTITPSPSPSVRPSKDLPTVTPSHSPSAGPGENGRGGEKLLSILFHLLKWMGLAAAAALLLWLGQYLSKRRRERVLYRSPSNRAALCCYGWLLRLTRWGGLVDDTALELARKARFSHHALSEEERAVMAVLFHDERQRIGSQLSGPSRLIFRYFWGIPKV